MQTVISLSGGLDSTCLLIKLLREGHRVRSYSFDYGQRHNRELECAKNVVEELQKSYDFTHTIIDVRSIFEGSRSALTSDIEVPKEEYNEDNLKKTVVPIRNVIFATILFSKALQWVQESGEKTNIALGVHCNDFAVYADTRQESVEAVKHALQISDDNGKMVDYIAPFVNMTKGELLESVLDGESIEVLSLTHSCYDPIGDKSCGTCATCRDRLAAFEYCSTEDPIEYIGDFDC